MYAFHIHTNRCKHAAVDSDEEYVQAALDLGMKQIVFSDHAPFPSDPFSGRMKYLQLGEYTRSLSALREKYKSHIEIYIGLEIEYMPEYMAYYEELIEKVDFLMLGQHHTSFQPGKYTFNSGRPKDEIYTRLLNSTIEAMQTGLFSVIAHPDRFLNPDIEWTWKEENYAKNIVKIADENGIFLEKNLSSVEQGKYYPAFWEYTTKDTKVVYGLDAHSVIELKRRAKALQNMTSMGGFEPPVQLLHDSLAVSYNKPL